MCNHRSLNFMTYKFIIRKHDSWHARRGGVKIQSDEFNGFNRQNQDQFTRRSDDAPAAP
jgi:hypothetical protein